MKSFISQLKEAQKDFLNTIKENDLNPIKKTLTYKIVDDTIKLSIECRDNDGFFVECFTYYRTDNTKLYQSKIECEGLFIRRP